MKKFKTFLLLVLGYTLGEFITQWRLHPEPISLRKYVKYYLSPTQAEYAKAKQVGELFWTDRTKSKKLLHDLTFPNQEK